jgi:hypothetical protein
MTTSKIKHNFVNYTLDDFDETKNYHRVLFRPGYAVQARELTQLQTSLQAQIDRYGQYAFKDGSRVLDGKVSINVEYDFIKIKSSFTHSIGGSKNSDDYLSDFLGSTITGLGNTGNQVTAKVIGFAAAAGSDLNTLYIKYEAKGGPNRDVSTFVADEEITSNASTVTGTVRYGELVASGSTPTGQGSIVNIEQGVYFIAGTFVYVEGASLLLDKYTNTPSYIVGLTVTESVISSDTSGHSALVDNATGTPNFAAPGANRYQISTTLVKEPLAIASRSTANYIPLVTVENGKVQFDKTDKNNDVALGRRLARRTFEESGNYAVQPFELNIREYLDTGTNFGYKTNTQIVADGDAGSNSAGTTFGTARLAVGVEPSVAYVKGFRNENLGTKYVKVEKPRGADATNTVNAATTDVVLGNYVRLKLASVAGLPDITNFTTLALKNQSGSNIGTARARGMEIVGSGSTGYAALYLFDIAMTGSNTFNSTRSVSQADSPLAFTADLINKDGGVGPAPVPGANTDAFLFDSGNSSLIFKLPYDAIKELPNNDNLFKVKQGFKVTSAASGNNVTFSVSGTNTFVDRANNIIAVNGGSFMKLDGTGAYTYSTNNTTTLVIAGVPNNTSVELIATVQKTNEAAKTKTRVNNATVSNTVGSGKIGLTKADVIRIVSVTDGNSLNVTERFSLDNGQRDNFYARGAAVLKPGFPTPTGTCTVTFDHYTHGSGTYFTVDSYPSADYETIGTFTGVKGELQLRDCVDFRPRIDDDGTDFTTTGASLTNPPHPGQSMNNDITYFMPRIDKLYVNRSGEFLIEKGVPADNPSSPATPDDAMGLYDLDLNPYVFSLSDIKPELLDNKRYTMRDIGKLDKRIKNLEYYTSLSLLEQNASDAHIVDSAGLSRFKNGFLVDAFNGHSVGDTANNDYMVSIDKGNGHLRPKFDERNVNLIRKASDSGSVVISSSLAHLPIASNTTIINQPYASSFINVNPYNVFSWDGVVKLSPDSDEWKEVDQRPAILIDDTSQYDQFLNMAEETGILGTVWNEWETNWTGQTEDRSVIQERINGRIRRTTTDTVTSTANQARSGLRRDLSFDTVQRESNDRVVEINFIPFMRSREIFFSAELLKPLTKFHAFFDGADITAFCKQKAFAEFATRSNIVDHRGVTSHPDSSSGTLTTDASGNLTGSFVIPNNSSLKFKTGSREFRLSDSSTNTIATETSSAESQYQARGLLESKQSTITSTKVPQLSTQELSDGRTIVETEVSEKVTWIDPIAESILITEEGGTFATSVDIFFQSKNAENIPVRLTIREMENGSPTQRIVPGADKVLAPGSVSVSEDDAVNATNFAFPHPVYLEQDHEYAIVLTSQCDDYNAWIAEMGKFDVKDTNFRITKQPYNGVFFSSANASTWTAEQSKDLKFKLNSAVFSTSGEITLVNDVLPVRALPSNPFTTAASDATVTVNHPNHGFPTNSSKVTFAGASAVNNISAANINGQRTVAVVDTDTYTFEAGGTANAAGSGGGTVTATENRHMDVMNNIIQNLTLPNTQLRFFATMHSSKSISGTETPYQTQTEFEILPGRNVIFAVPKLVASQENETAEVPSGAKSYKLRCTMSTTKTNLSPVIDMNRASLISVQNRINNGSAAETASSGGNNIARYITKTVNLADDADVITAFLDVNRPAASNIDLYFRVITSGAETPITETAWTLATPTATIPINDNPSVFTEAQYDIDPLGANVSFGSMQFKIVLRSTNTSTVPKVKDFRAIAAT